MKVRGWTKVSEHGSRSEAKASAATVDPEFTVRVSNVGGGWYVVEKIKRLDLSKNVHIV